MRWLALITSFFSLVFVSFLIFLWTWRCDLIARSFELSLSNAPTKVESVTAHSLHCFGISHITIQPKDSEPLIIEKILLEVDFYDLLSWMCLPIKAPLVIEKATIAFQKCAPWSPLANSSPDLLIKTTEVISPDGKNQLIGEEKGSIGSILTDILQTIPAEQTLQS